MIIDYYGSPSESIFYTAARLYKHLKITGCGFDEAYDFFIATIDNNPTLFYYSLDWLYLLGRIHRDGKGGFVCD